MTTFDKNKLKSAKPLSDAALCERMAQRGTEVLRSEDGSYSLRKSSLTAPAEAMAADALKALCIKRGVAWDERYLNRVVRHWASDARVDSHGDIVVQSWDMRVFETNSPMPLSHNWFGLPVGKVLDWSVVQRNEADYTGPALRTIGVIALPEANPIADQVNGLIKGGLMPGCSVGFKPLSVLDVTDEEERKKLGLGRYGLVFEHNQLLELSPTMIPANPGAVTFGLFKSAAEAGYLTPEAMCVLRELRRQSVLGKKDAERQFTASEVALFQIARALWPEQPWVAHKDLEMPVEVSSPIKVDGLQEKTLSDEARKAFSRLHTSINEIKASLEAHTEALSSHTSALDEMKGLMQEVCDAMPMNGGGDSTEEPAPAPKSAGESRLNTELSKLFAKLRGTPAAV